MTKPKIDKQNNIIFNNQQEMILEDIKYRKTQIIVHNIRKEIEYYQYHKNPDNSKLLDIEKACILLEDMARSYKEY